jgi:hypothetical protein
VDSSIQTETRWWDEGEKRCLRCKHWHGDRDEEWERIREWINEDYDLDKLDAIKAGPCNEGPYGINLNLGCVDITVDADFGCVEWEAIDGE